MAKARIVPAGNPGVPNAILDAAEAIMVEEGYAAVSARRVADRAGIKPALLQYYFPSMDGLLLDLYRRAADAVAVRQAKALASDTPLQDLWTMNADAKRTALAIEFMALANHRKEIKAEISLYNERARKEQVAVLSKHLEGKLPGNERYTPAAMSLLIAAIARALIMEKGLGIHSGHADLRALVVHWLQELDKPAKAGNPPSKRPRRS